MKKLIAVLVMVMGPVLLHADDHLNDAIKHMTQTHDKFKESTCIGLDSNWQVGHQQDAMNLRGPDGKPTSLSMDFLATIEDGGKRKTVISLIINSDTDDWVYLKAHDFHCLVDGKKFIPEDTSYDNEVYRGGVTELIYVELTEKQLARLATAKKVECQVACTDFDLSDLQIHLLQELAKRIDQVKANPN